MLLIVQPTGHKAFALRFRRPDGRPAKLTLGPFDASGLEPKDGPALGAPLTLAAARALAAEIQRKRVHGQDVVADRKAEKRRRAVEIKDAAANSFRAAALDFIEQYARPKLRRCSSPVRVRR